MKQPRYLRKILAIVAMLSIISGCTMPSTTPTPTAIAPFVPSAIPTFTLATQIIDASPSPVIVTDTVIPTQVPIPTNTLCSPPAGWSVYIVQSGDNLFRIGLRYGLSSEDVRIANCLPDNTIVVGQTLYVPYFIPPTPVPPTSVPPTATQFVVQPDIQEQVRLDTGGESGSIPPCTPPTATITPQITISQRLNDMYALCIYDFPQTEEINVDLYAPDRHWVADNTSPHSGVLNGRTLIIIKLWMPVGVPTGDWFATVASKSITLEKQAFLISPITGTATNTMPPVEINPFATEKKCGDYTSGDEVNIRGTGFGQLSNLSIGIYLNTFVQDEPSKMDILQLVSAQSVQVNQGKFSTSITIQPSDPVGIYWVLPILSINDEVYKDYEFINDCYRVK